MPQNDLAIENPWNIDYSQEIDNLNIKKLQRESEILILKQIIQTLRHGKSDYFVFNETSQGYDVPIQIKLNSSKLNLVHEILDKNKIYHNLRNSLAAKKSKVLGSVQKIFFEQVQSHLDEYDQLLSNIENKIINDSEDFCTENGLLMSTTHIECPESPEANGPDKILNELSGKSGQEQLSGKAKVLTLKGLYLD